MSRHTNPFRCWSKEQRMKKFCCTFYIQYWRSWGWNPEIRKTCFTVRISMGKAANKKNKSVLSMLQWSSYHCWATFSGIPRLWPDGQNGDLWPSSHQAETAETLTQCRTEGKPTERMDKLKNFTEKRLNVVLCWVWKTTQGQKFIYIAGVAKNVDSWKL